jgi:hypothetical protein
MHLLAEMRELLRGSGFIAPVAANNIQRDIRLQNEFPLKPSNI